MTSQFLVWLKPISGKNFGDKMRFTYDLAVLQNTQAGDLLTNATFVFA